jgi:hypothetical protein
MDLQPQRDALDAIYGPTSGDLTVELFTAHEDAGGVEITGDGYTPGVIDALDWAAADTDGIKATAALVSLGTPTDEWSDTATHYVLRDGTGDSWGCFRWATPITIGGAGSELLVRPSVFFGDNDN